MLKFKFLTLFWAVALMGTKSCGTNLPVRPSILTSVHLSITAVPSQICLSRPRFWPTKPRFCLLDFDLWLPDSDTPVLDTRLNLEVLVSSRFQYPDLGVFLALWSRSFGLCHLDPDLYKKVGRTDSHCFIQCSAPLGGCCSDSILSLTHRLGVVTRQGPYTFSLWAGYSLH